MALDIPQEDTGSIAVIRTLPPASLGKFISALTSASAASNPREMVEQIAKHVPSIPITQLTPVVETLYTLYYIRELSGVKHARFIDDLLDGVRNSPHIRVPQKDLPKLRSVLEKLMSIETLHTVAKAARLQRDGERLYCEAKILSDMRPIFGPDATEPPVGAVLTHTLRIGYHEGSSHKEFHVILDSDDLMALSEVIIRAQEKENTLRGLLKRIKLPNLGE
jgi:hypothetical protein